MEQEVNETEMDLIRAAKIRELTNLLDLVISFANGAMFVFKLLM